MPIRIHHGDVLDAPATALLCTVSPDSISDFQSVEKVNRILGKVAGQFSRRWPAAWESVVEALSQGEREGELALLEPGGCAFVKLDDSGCPFTALELISTLSHDENVDKRRLAEFGLSNGLRELFENDQTEIAMTPPAGGWRLSLEAAFGVLIHSFRRAITTIPKEERLDVELSLWVKDESAATLLQRLLQKL